MTRTRSRLGISIVIGILTSLIPMSALPAAATTGDLVITGVVDGPLTGGLPKAIELHVVNDIADLSIYGVGSANNGGGTNGEEFGFPAVGATAGDYIYLATEAVAFTSFFGFAPDYTSASAPSINGDDAIELFMNGTVVDVFGEIDMSGTGQPWEYVDGWAHRVDGTGQDGSTFILANWAFSGINALDGATTNATASAPFPSGTYRATTSPPGPTTPVIINEVDADSTSEFVELYDGGTGGTPLDGLVLVFYDGLFDLTYASVDLDGLTTDSSGYAVICGVVEPVFAPNCDFDATAVIRDGAHAVALYEGDASDFPGNLALTTGGLADALVYDTSDADDPELAALLHPGQPQVDENGAGAGATHSNSVAPTGAEGPGTPRPTPSTPPPSARPTPAAWLRPRSRWCARSTRSRAPGRRARSKAAR